MIWLWAVKGGEEGRMIPKSLSRSSGRVGLSTRMGRTAHVAGWGGGCVEQGLTLDVLV